MYIKSETMNHSMGLSGEKPNQCSPYQCDQCEKSFTQSSHLRRHLYTHNCVKLYQCSRCTKAFSTKQHLTAHMRIHTGEKPYQCNQCDKAFSVHANFKTAFEDTHWGETT